MTKITRRAQLDSRLGDVARIYMLLIGDDETTRKVHAHARKLEVDGKLRADLSPLHVPDITILKPGERSSWTAKAGDYLTLRADAAGKFKLGASGATKDLLRADGVPSTLKIKGAFRRGGSS